MKMLPTCFSTAFALSTSSAPIARFDRPCRDQLQHVALAGRQSFDRRRPSAEQLPHHVWIDHRTACSDLVDSVEEHVDVADPILEQVAESAVVAADEVDGMAALDVLREHEHRDRMIAPAQCRHAARMPSLVCVGGRRTSVTTRSGGPPSSSSSSAHSSVASSCSEMTSCPTSPSSRTSPPRSSRWSSTKEILTPAPPSVVPASRPSRAAQGPPACEPPRWFPIRPET